MKDAAALPNLLPGSQLMIYTFCDDALNPSNGGMVMGADSEFTAVSRRRLSDGGWYG